MEVRPGTMEDLEVNSNFWKGKNILLTGHTGFKGSWLSLWLKKLGANVTGFALEPSTNPSLFNILQLEKDMVSFIGDIRDPQLLNKVFYQAEPDIVIHMAAQTLVRDSYSDPVGTYATNIMGTVNLLEAVRKTPSIKVVLNITSDKCYENDELNRSYCENDPMGGYDPYSSSKGCAELVSSAYRRSFLEEANIVLATARSGNVVGGGDWAKDRIIPDAIRAFFAGTPLMVRNPKAIRPWQHVLDPLRGYLMLIEHLWHDGKDFAQGWNFGTDESDAKSVSWVTEKVVSLWGNNAKWTLDNSPTLHEAQYLKLDSNKSRTRLGWQPHIHIEQALIKTVEWYKAWANKKDMRAFTLQQINASIPGKET